MKLSLFATILAAVPIASFAQTNLTTNGGFEAGDVSDWVSFPTPSSTFAVTGDAATGSFAGELFNDTITSAAVIKQANLGIGVVSPGQEITISFSAKGTGVAGGVSFAEFFSEIDGGGTSKAEILSGAPLSLTSTYQTFNFMTTAGADVSGGVTLQFTATTGGAPGSTMQLFVDNVSVSVVPEPSALAFLLGFGGLAFLGLRRRR